MHPPLPPLTEKPKTGKAVSALVLGIFSPLILAGGFGLLMLAHVKEAIHVIVLGFGILGVFGLSGLCALMAIVLGHSRLSDIRKLPHEISGRGMAITGMVLGYVMIFILTAWILTAIIVPRVAPLS